MKPKFYFAHNQNYLCLKDFVMFLSYLLCLKLHNVCCFRVKNLLEICCKVAKFYGRIQNSLLLALGLLLSKNDWILQKNLAVGGILSNIKYIFIPFMSKTSKILAFPNYMNSSNRGKNWTSWSQAGCRKITKC